MLLLDSINSYTLKSWLQNKEWTCESKEVTCPEVSCEGNMITMGCCSVCAGTSNDRPHHMPVSSWLHCKP